MSSGFLRPFSGDDSEGSVVGAGGARLKRSGPSTLDVVASTRRFGQILRSLTGKQDTKGHLRKRSSKSLEQVKKAYKPLQNKKRFQHTQIEVREKIDTKKVMKKAKAKLTKADMSSPKKKPSKTAHFPWDSKSKSQQITEAVSITSAPMRKDTDESEKQRVDASHVTVGDAHADDSDTATGLVLEAGVLPSVAQLSAVKVTSEIERQVSHPSRDENETAVVYDDTVYDSQTIVIHADSMKSADSLKAVDSLKVVDEDIETEPEVTSDVDAHWEAKMMEVEMGAGATGDLEANVKLAVGLGAEMDALDASAVVVMDTMIPVADESHYSYFVPKDKKKAGRRIVFFDGKLKRVSEIETASETFAVVYHYYLTWLMSYDEVVDYFKAKAKFGANFEKKWKPEWHPELECENRVDGDMEQLGPFKVKEGVTFRCLKTQNPEKDFKNGRGNSSFDISLDQLGFDPRYAFWCRIQYDCDLHCAEELELEFFPFDCQDLGIYMRAKEKANACDILPFPRFGEIFNIDAQYSMVSEWNIPGVLLEFNQGDPNSSKMGVPYNTVTIRIKAERKWEAHLADSTTVMAMFWLGLCTFSIPVEDVGDRLAYCITLLLADIATMQLLNETTPTIPYRTFLDTYTYSCFSFLVVVTVWASLAGWSGEANASHVVDWWAFWLFFTTLVSLHLLFIQMIHYGRTDEKSKLKMSTDELDDFFKSSAGRDSESVMPMAGVSWSSRSIDPDKLPTAQKKRLGIRTFEDDLGWSGRSYPWAQVVEDDYEPKNPLLQEVVAEDQSSKFKNIFGLRRTISL